MSASNQKADLAVDLALFGRNRQQIPPELLVPYAGQWVAISGDGTRILASGSDMDAVEQKLAELGIPANSVGLERIPADDESTWL